MFCKLQLDNEWPLRGGAPNSLLSSTFRNASNLLFCLVFGQQCSRLSREKGTPSYWPPNQHGVWSYPASPLPKLLALFIIKVTLFVPICFHSEFVKNGNNWKFQSKGLSGFLQYLSYPCSAAHAPSATSQQIIHDQKHKRLLGSVLTG